MKKLFILFILSVALAIGFYMLFASLGVLLRSDLQTQREKRFIRIESKIDFIMEFFCERYEDRTEEEIKQSVKEGEGIEFSYMGQERTLLEGWKLKQKELQCQHGKQK